jgi:hypothetical protein
MDQQEEKQPAPAPIEPGHVMSRKQYEKWVAEQQK